MSKRRRRTDYNRMSSYNEVEEVRDVGKPEELVDFTVHEERIEEPEVEISNVIKLETGKVANCEKLNVRKSASVDSPVVTIIEKGTEVEINPNKSVDGWYAISNGFVMSKFIEKE